MFFELKENANYNLNELENMYPFERNLFLDMIIDKREQEKEQQNS